MPLFLDHRRPTFAAVAALLLMAATPTFASKPNVALLLPIAVQAGQTVNVKVRGERLEDADGILTYQAGITAKKVEFQDKQVLMRLQVAADCQLGRHVFRLRSESGLSNMVSLWVGQQPVVLEKEPNNQFDQAQVLDWGTTVVGGTPNDDTDFFCVHAEAGRRFSVEVAAMRLGQELYDTVVEIYDASHQLLQAIDDVSLTKQDPAYSFLPPKGGEYYIAIHDATYHGRGRGRYAMHIGSFPRPLHATPTTAQVGEELDITWIDAENIPTTTSVTIPSSTVHPTHKNTTASYFDWFAKDEFGTAPSPITIKLTDVRRTAATEPNDGVPQSTDIGKPPLVCEGAFESPGDTDFLRFQASKGEELNVVLRARDDGIRSPTDPAMNILQATGQSVSFSDDNTNQADSVLRFNPPTDGEFLVKAFDWSRRGGPEFTYRLEITPVIPRLALELPDTEQFKSTTVSVPRGNHMAFVVVAKREQCEGAIDLSFPDLPPGVTTEPVQVHKDRDRAVVLFSADADAPLSGSLIQTQGTVARDPTPPLPTITGHLQQRTSMLILQNRDMCGHVDHRLAVAVTDRVPFAIQAKAPTLGVVRNGATDLAVEVHRDEGFKVNIQLRVLDNPPGIGTTANVIVPGDKSEGQIRITANENAMLETWPMIVIATAYPPEGPLQVASLPVALPVGDRYFDVTWKPAVIQQSPIPADPSAEGESQQSHSQVAVAMRKLRDYPGEGVATLVGLPAGVTAEPLTLSAETTELIFDIRANQDARPGMFKTLLLQVTFTDGTDTVTQTLGQGQLRIDPRPNQQAKS